MNAHQNIIITGANGNLGSIVVKKFLEEGYHVIAVDKHNDTLRFAKDHPRFEWHYTDLLDATAVQDFINIQIQKHQQIHAALLLAGGFEMGNIANTSMEAIHKMIQLNFATAYHLAQPLFLHMQAAGYGRLVLVGARPAIDAAEGQLKMAYALSKSLLFTFAEQLNAAGKAHHIDTAVIIPSIIDTPANRAAMPDARFEDWVHPDSIAHTLAFICSEKAAPLREGIYKLYNEV